MKANILKVVFFLALVQAFSLINTQSKAQSIAYKTLLSTLYDSDFPVIKAGEINDLEDFQVLDTREKKEYEVSHLYGAKWVGFDTFDLQNVADLDKNKPVLVYCTVGARSEAIGKKLVDAGFSHVLNLYGGIIQWSNEGRLVFVNNSPTDKVHTYSKSWGVWLNQGKKVY